MEPKKTGRVPASGCQINSVSDIWAVQLQSLKMGKFSCSYNLKMHLRCGSQYIAVKLR